MPNRILKQSICSSDTVDQLTWFEEVLFYRLIVNCDDYGRFDGRVAIIKNLLFPLKESMTAKDVSKAVNKLAAVGLVILYEHDGKPYLQLSTWNDHQNVRAKKSKYPSPDSNSVNNGESENICMQMQADAPGIQSNTVSESNSVYISEKAKRFSPPTLEEVKAYCDERHNNVDPEKWYDFYQSKGWKIGNNTMKDWKAAVRTWERNDYGNKPPNKNAFTRGVMSSPEHENQYADYIRTIERGAV